VNTALKTFLPAKAKSPRLRDEFRAFLTLHHFSRRTVDCYISWVLQFVIWSGKRDPHLMGHTRVETTMIYNHVISPVEKRIKSPLDL
jgi:hypothetical protein